MKKYLLPISYSLVVLLIGSLITTILYYFNLTSDKFNSILLYLVGIISIFIGSYLMSKKNKHKGILIGTFYFILFFIISLIISLFIFKTPFKFSNIIYYIIILLFSILGGIIGKNFQEETDTIN